MVKKIVKNRFLLSTVIFICALFTFSGAVNLGFSGFLMATPFLGLWIIIALMAGRKIIIISLMIFLLLILPFYILKVTTSAIYFPANGKEIVLKQDACFNVYTNKYTPPFEDFILADSLVNEEDCLRTKQSVEDVKKSKIVVKGTKYRIEKTELSHADFGEHFHAIVHDSDGKLTIFNPKIFDFSNGSKLTEKDLQQPYLYYPSLLMNWPVFPLILKSFLLPKT